MDDKRDTSIDFIKGMLMFGVVYGHVISALMAGSHQQVWLHTFMRTFDMPFFMLLSGFFFRKSLSRNGFLKVLRNRLTMIFVPIVFWTAIRGHLNIFGGMYYFLWAVFASGVLCLMARAITHLFPQRFAFPAEMALLLVIIVGLHCFNSPWNMFYLYPFFAVGYCMDSVPKRLPQLCETMVFLTWIALLCFWRRQYTPWDVNGIAWCVDGKALFVYGYRFALALLGVHIMWKVFDGVRYCLGEMSWFVKLITRTGTETLAIYIVHIILLSGLKRCVPFVPIWALSNVNIVGYVMSPVIAILLIVILLPFIGLVKKLPLLKYCFGFRVG